MQTRTHQVPGILRRPTASFFHALAILFNSASFIDAGRRLLQGAQPHPIGAHA